MDLEKICHFSKVRFREIGRFFALASQAFEEEAIHQMRVEIKRLRALCQLLQALAEGFQAKDCLLPIRPIYKSAGKIRDLQVQTSLARQWMKASGSKGLEAYCRHLALSEKQAQADFREQSQFFDAAALDGMEKLLEHALSSFTAGQARRRALRLLQALQSELLQRSQASKPYDDLHPLRILAKRTRHTTELLQMCLSSPPPCAQVAAAVRDIEQALGQWHDQAVALAFVKSFQGQSETSPACQEFRQCLAAKKRQLRQDFVQLLPSLKSLLRGLPGG